MYKFQLIYVACLLCILCFSDNCRTEKEKQTLLREGQAEDEVKKSGINARGWEVCYLLYLTIQKQ